MVMINNGRGNGGYSAEVNSKSQLLTSAVTQPHDRVLANEGKAWSLPFTATPTATDDYIFYLKNDGVTEIHITDIRIQCAAADTFYYEEVTGTAAGGTDIVPENRNLGSSKIPSATIQSGNDITGISAPSSFLFFERCDTANKLYHLRTSSNIHIPQGAAFGIRASTGTALTDGVVSITEDEASAL